MTKICLVDDDMDLTNLTKIALVKKGYEVTIFNDSRKAIEEIRKRKPDLILMDIMMPKMSGAEAVRELKKDPDIKDIPVIFLTALISEREADVEESGISIDGINYKTLGKPYEMDELLKLIEK